MEGRRCQIMEPLKGHTTNAPTFVNVSTKRQRIATLARQDVSQATGASGVLIRLIGSEPVVVHSVYRKQRNQDLRSRMR